MSKTSQRASARQRKTWSSSTHAQQTTNNKQQTNNQSIKQTKAQPCTKASGLVRVGACTSCAERNGTRVHARFDSGNASLEGICFLPTGGAGLRTMGTPPARERPMAAIEEMATRARVTRESESESELRQAVGNEGWQR